jgi:hypothetical protein
LLLAHTTFIIGQLLLLVGKWKFQHFLCRSFWQLCQDLMVCCLLGRRVFCVVNFCFWKTHWLIFRNFHWQNWKPKFSNFIKSDYSANHILKSYPNQLHKSTCPAEQLNYYWGQFKVFREHNNRVWLTSWPLERQNETKRGRSCRLACFIQLQRAFSILISQIQLLYLKTFL